MYTLEDIYSRLATGADGMLRGSGFVEPTTGPRTTGRTLNEIMGVAPLSDDGSGLDAALCVAGRTFWSLLTTSWGPQVCTAPNVGQENIRPGTTDQVISAGFHDGIGTVAGDADLASTNIASGVEIFGVSGSALLASGDATDSQVLEGITYSNDSGASTGTMPNVGQQSFIPGTTDQVISSGFHDGTGTVAGDPDLASSNIADGVDIFGVSGSALLASGDAIDSQVLEGATYSNDSGASTGTMPNIGQQNITPGTTDQTSSRGFHDGTGIVAGDPDLASPNIASGVEIFGVNGSAMLASGAATDSQVLEGVTYSNDSGTSTGTMPNVGRQNITPGTTDQTISAGFHDGTGIVAGDPDLASLNIASGVEIFGVNGSAVLASGAATDGQVLSGVTYSNTSGASTGTMPSIGAQNVMPGRTAVPIMAGFHSGSGTVAGDADLVPGNIRSGVHLFGVTGNPQVVNTSSGDAVATDITSGRIAWVDGVEVTGTRGGCTGTLHGTRWCDNGDGTVTDLMTGLIWLRDAGCAGRPAWSEPRDLTSFQPGAHTRASRLFDGSREFVGGGDCGLSDGSVEGDWRLPSFREIRSLALGPEPVFRVRPGPFVGIQDFYWSSTSSSNPDFARCVNTSGGFLDCFKNAIGRFSAWPVRTAL